MNELEQNKFNTLKNMVILCNEYSDVKETYEKRLQIFEKKLKKKNFERLLDILENFADYVFETLAKNKKVFVKLSKARGGTDEELNEMFAEFEDLE